MAICGMKPWRMRRKTRSSRVGVSSCPVVHGAVVVLAVSGLGGKDAMRLVDREGFPSCRGTFFRFLMGFLLFPLLALPAFAQQSELRTVRGAVLDKAENPVVSAVVYLKNVQTLAVKTYISDRSGEYRFSGLDPNVDYEVHAETENMMSNTRTVSSLDSRKDIVISLKVDKEKKKT